MAQALNVSQAGLDLIKRFEGFQAEPLELPEGWWLFGFNHVANEKYVGLLSRDAAEDLLRRDLQAIEAKLNGHVLFALCQEQFDALVSFAFSIGWEEFVQSEVLRDLNAGALVAAADGILAWRYGAFSGKAGLLSVLARRRAIESAWLLDQGQHVPVASALVCPRLGAQDEFGPASDQMAAQTEELAGAQAGEADAMTERLRAILAAEPASARNLLPPMVHEELEEEEFPLSLAPALQGWQRPDSWLETAARDHVALGAFTVMGAVLIGVGLGLMPGSPDFSRTLAGLLFALPGALITGGALFFLFRGALIQR